MAFAPTRHSGVTLWEGDPDCQAAHDALLARLIAMNSTFIGAAAVLVVNRKGNLENLSPSMFPPPTQVSVALTNLRTMRPIRWGVCPCRG